MTKRSPNDAMNRLLNALRLSVATDLRFARPWVKVSVEPSADALWQVAQMPPQT